MMNKLMSKTCRKQHIKKSKWRKGCIHRSLRSTCYIYKPPSIPTTTIGFDTPLSFCLKKRKNVPHSVAEGEHYFNKHSIEMALKYCTMNKND